MTMIFGFLGFVFVATVAGVIFFGSLYLWIRYVFGEKHAGKVTGFCLKLTLVLVAVAILAEPVLLVVGIFWLTVEYFQRVDVVDSCGAFRFAIGSVFQ